jgi:PAS domain S-box-containing protein
LSLPNARVLHSPETRHSALPAAPQDPARQVVHALISIAALACLASIAAVVFITRTQQPQAFTAGLVASFSFAALLVAAAAVATRGRVKAAVVIALGAMLLGATLFSLLSKMGIHNAILSAQGLIIVVAGVVLGMRAALGFAAACLAVVCAMYVGELYGLFLGPQGSAVPGAARLVTWLLLISVSVAFAWLLARILRSSFEAARLKEERFGALVRHSTLSFLIHRGDRIELANDAAARLFGYDSTQALSGVAPAALDGVGAHGSLSALAAEGERLASGASLPLRELRLRRKDGGDLVVETQLMRIEQPDGPASLSVFLDHTEHRRAKAQLARSDALIARLVEATVDAVVVSSFPGGKIELVNKGFVDLSGIPAAQAHGSTAVELGIWAVPAERDAFLETVARDGFLRDYPAHLRCANGDVRSVLLATSIFQLEGTSFTVSIMRDVTQMQRERLEYGAILENASVGIAFTRNQRFVLANPRFEQMFGWSRGEIDGKPGAIVWCDDEDYAHIGRIAGPVLARGEPVDFERLMRRKDGTLFACHLRGRAIDSVNPAAGGTIWITEDVTERRAAEAAIATAKEAAEAASRAKSMFLANTSHEIRTPLNGVLGLARLALEPGVEPHRLRDYLTRIHDSAQTLSAIINDILDLSKIEAGKLAIERTDFDLRALVDAVYAGYRDLARGKDLAFELAVAGDVPRHVRGDPTRVRQILANFVSNAIKFTDRGRVAIDVRRRPDDRLRFTITDSGIGIDADTRPRLFAPFTQADASTTRRFGGTGLGLSICRQLAELMGGAVGLDSTTGIGSTFWVELPLEQAAAPVPSPAAPPLGDEDALRGLRVLVVEDNPVNMLLAETLLANWGVEVVQAHDGRQAIEAVGRGGRFDVVLMDVHMPVMSGHEATARLRQRFDKDELPIVALTAAALASEQEQSLALGMNDFITKPFDAMRLRGVLVQLAARRQRAPAHPAA